MCGEVMEERIFCSLCKDSDREWESSADLTAKTWPDLREVARETVAVEPWPMACPLDQFI
uniref:Uncharacterized protein n=1 Tax=Rhizophora mucronata TaxID=61149 RepID=A0A2P2QVA2_RHIMU